MVQVDDAGGGGSLLSRVRLMFRNLALLLLLVEVLEWIDADTALVPQRLTAAVALVAATALVLALHHRPAALGARDLAMALTVLGTGWGLGRPGAVLSLLLGAALQRSLYGSRNAMVAATASLVAAYVATVVAIKGPTGMLDLNLLVVGAALGSFAAVIRLVGEVIAVRDRDAVWDAIAAATAEQLLRTADAGGPARITDTAVARMTEAASDASGGILPADGVPDGVALRRARLAVIEGLVRDRTAGEARFRELAEHSDQGIYMRRIDAPDELTYLNPAAQTMLGATVDPTTGTFHASEDLIHPDDRALVLAAIGAEGYIATPIVHRTLVGDAEPGEERWIEIVERPFHDEDGVVTVVQGTARDVSRQQREEQALRDALEREAAATRRLQDVDRLRSTFLSAVSHELRTPLATVLGAAQTLMAHHRELDEAQRERFIDSIVRQASRLHTLLNDLLDVERLASGRIEAERVPVRVLELTRRTIDSAQLDGDRVSIGGVEVEAALDASQVERIVENLVRNALKHTRHDTPVRVHVEPYRDGAKLVVEDDGDGVPERLRSALFEPFVQGPGADRAASPGTGIGLSLVGEFAALHGGRAWVEEAASGGARFVVTLPGPDGDPSADRPAAVSADAPDAD